jgi:hypothetical protein
MYGPFEYVLYLEEQGTWVSNEHIKYLIANWDKFILNFTTTGDVNGQESSCYKEIRNDC